MNISEYEYRKEFIDIEVGLINSFLIAMPKEIIDICYYYLDKQLIIQVVLVEGAKLSEKIKDRVFKNFVDFKVYLKELYIPKKVYANNDRNDYLEDKLQGYSFFSK